MNYFVFKNLLLFMISSRGHKGEFEVPIEAEDKKVDELPRSSTAPKEEISINVSVLLSVFIFLILMYFFMIWNAEHYSGFFFGRLT